MFCISFICSEFASEHEHKMFPTTFLFKRYQRRSVRGTISFTIAVELKYKGMSLEDELNGTEPVSIKKEGQDLPHVVNNFKSYYLNEI